VVQLTAWPSNGDSSNASPIETAGMIEKIRREHIPAPILSVLEISFKRSLERLTITASLVQ
jgi:hypothetical protein